MEGFEAIPYIFLVLAVAAIIGGAGAIVLDQFGNTMDQCYNSSYTYNSTFGSCIVNNGSGVRTAPVQFNFSEAYNVVWEGQQANLTVAAQLSTVGIIGIMVIIIGLLSGVFVYFKHFR